MKMRMALIALLVCGLGSAGLAAQTKDDGLTKVLDKLGGKYNVSNNGTIWLTYTLPNNRKQTVQISAKPSPLGGLLVREIWSNAGLLPESADVNDVSELLYGNANEVVGAWSLERVQEGELLYFSLKLPIPSRPEDLKSLIGYVATVADQKEAELTGKDEN